MLVGRGAASLLVSSNTPLLNTDLRNTTEEYQLINPVQGGTGDALASAILAVKLESDHSAATVSAAVGAVHGG